MCQSRQRMLLIMRVVSWNDLNRFVDMDTGGRTSWKDVRYSNTHGHANLRGCLFFLQIYAVLFAPYLAAGANCGALCIKTIYEGLCIHTQCLPLLYDIES